ncbi:hypothetical protein CKM354_000266700 [Cercospora kikuchii]|uniref:Apple domain-containing protein n=1 Tax=Cercospora kikuchii TaxID=84275 RepID=A0A9P3CAI8_9PEZI|nr:uncharacterized protein CKM354_000266700 [Cercospora kikuchii]GIZ39278.1 hypothetical protein CKM354_000266700 [Cercospora kikuchii]
MARFSHRICDIAVASCILYATARAQNGPRTVTVVPLPSAEAASGTSSEPTTASVAPAASGISCPADDGRNYTGYAGSYYVECDMEIGGLLLDNDMANKLKRQAMTPETCMAGCQMYGDSCAGVNYRPGSCVYLASINTLSPSEGTIALLKGALLAGPPTTYPTASFPATTTSSSAALSSIPPEQSSSATGDVELPGGYPGGPSISSAVPLTATSSTTGSNGVPNSYATGASPSSSSSAATSTSTGASPSIPSSTATSSTTGVSAVPNTSSTGSFSSSTPPNTTIRSTTTGTLTSVSDSISSTANTSGPSTVNVCSNVRTRTTTITTTSTLTTCLPEDTCPTAHYKL